MHAAPPSPATGPDDAVSAQELLWQHRAFCGLALPLRAPRSGLWTREAAGTSLAMGAEDAASGEDRPLPAGRGLRLLLLHVFTAALRGGSAAAGIGPDLASVALQLGLEPAPARLRELGEQLDRLLSARLRAGTEGRGAALSVLDARRLGKGGGPAAWRPVLHLSARFFASLQEQAVPLDRAVVAKLADSAPALDAYAWLAASADAPAPVSWADLQQRFGQGGAATAVNTAAFRAAFTESLDAVAAAWPEARFTVGEDGVALHGSPAPAASAPAIPAPPPEAAPEAPPPEAAPEAPPPEAAPEAPPPEAAPSDAREDAAHDDAPAPPEAESKIAAEAVPEPEREPERDAPTEPASEPAPAAPAAPAMPPPARIRLAPVLTGLSLSVWLRRGEAQESATIEVTPGATDHPAHRSLLILEPMVLQVSGHLQPRELEQVAAWVAANAELIQDYWDGAIASVFDVAGRVRPVPASRW